MKSRAGLIIVAAVVSVVVFFTATDAYAHGRIHGWIQPAWDCYKYINPETGVIHGTEGDIAVIVTERDGFKYYVKWRCYCEKITQTGTPKWLCWWKVVEIRRKLANMYIPSNTANYKKAYLQIRRVKWWAFHPGVGTCVKHTARRAVIFAERR